MRDYILKVIRILKPSEPMSNNITLKLYIYLQSLIGECVHPFVYLQCYSGNNLFYFLPVSLEVIDVLGIVVERSKYLSYKSTIEIDYLFYGQ